MEIHNKNNETLTALVDIDETICFYEGERIYELAIPNSNNIAKINALYDEGWDIIYWTARGSTQPTNKQRLKQLRALTINQLNEWGAKYNELEIGDKKPLFDLVIDDKAKRIEEL
jgi:hypothetical protein